ncbi:MAG: DASH family cryptochrome [Pseudomonadota bacterium]
MPDIYWFQNDLRLSDNPALASHLDADQLLLVYCWPESIPWCNVNGVGQQRRRFLVESLQSLQRELRPLGQDLLILNGSPQQALPQLAAAIGASCVGTALTPGYYERKTREQLALRLRVPLKVHQGNTLFSADELPFAVDAMPGQFTPFKNKVENQAIPEPISSPSSLPPPPAGIQFADIANSEVSPHTSFAIRGGSTAAKRRLQQWTFGQRDILRYKQTRNCLDGLDGSSSLSPWLAMGCVSPREVASEVKRFEQEVESNDSTYWMIFELLWREFFHHRALQDDISLFRIGGSPGKVRRCTFEPRNFARWCQGDTDYPLVNALMHQLVASGWMSNRGRQIAASCLINEYGIEWRYGAAFFEKHLIDYDVASNYGNWQYIAGVGADPRGGRHFNQQKQAAQYDPQQLCVNKWDGVRPAQPEYVTDAADWPL